ncbi:NAD(P)-dependent oxidoreductase [Parafrankia sp. EUN1f]|uniref:NAD-dependent epimerase/dehydratase family protein n=1 Tax=Parafrankia sp. EUN1f TaxID=102897 RepID=UPI0001C45188|nr:NAD(P)-dependent oxidoreductase [Parafrankia sp. EUN1f]EFC84102.1 NAD-dependent epimerase/dehydratase [Parafrankia sp. EUN1f]
MARSVVTGAAGFLGGAVAQELRQRGDEVVALDVRRGPGITQADVTTAGDWEKALDGADLLVHAAAVGMGGVGELTPVRAGRVTPPSRVTTAQMRKVLLGGTATVLDAAQRAGVGRVIHLSCVSALGGDAPMLADESAPVGLTGEPRADAIAAAEQTANAAAAHGAPVTVLRIADAYGPRAGRWTLWPVLLMRAGRFVLVDGGGGRLSPVHVDDVVAAVTAVAAAPVDVVAGRVLHVTGPEATTGADFFGRYAALAEVRPPRSVPARLCEVVDAVDRLPGRSRSASGRRPGLLRGLGAKLVVNVDPRVRVDLGPLTIQDLTRTGTVSGRRIAELVGWEPRVDLDEGMRRTGAWLRDRGLLGVTEPARRG